MLTCHQNGLSSWEGRGKWKEIAPDLVNQRKILFLLDLMLIFFSFFWVCEVVCVSWGGWESGEQRVLGCVDDIMGGGGGCCDITDMWECPG